MSTADFLVEIGTEELPPSSLKTLAKAFAAGIKASLEKADLQVPNLQVFATPRRLAVLIRNLAEHTPNKALTVWGPPAKIAYDEQGELTKAGLAFANKNDLTPAELEVANDGKVDKLMCRTTSGGLETQSLLMDIVNQALNQLPISKRMRWGTNREEFVRPVHWVVMLFGDTLVPGEVLGIQAGNQTRGHRFHCNEALTLAQARDYEDLLHNTGYVIADMEKRQQIIHEQVTQAAQSIDGEAVIDEELLSEVSALVEWPVALTGRFDTQFLQVPAEALISSMKEHQKYFHIIDKNGQLLPNFVAVANIESQDPSQVIDGNERVIHPRLADAAFFFEQDKQISLADRREKLHGVVFQAQLGSLYEKTKRLEALVEFIAQQLDEDPTPIMQAARLCKSDLVSQLVCEFPELQGIAAYYYAQNDGEAKDIALAIKEHYLPKFAGDKLASTSTGAILALADRIDTLIGIFGIGQVPTGSKDPFGLRRASLAILRIIMEKSFTLDLKTLLEFSARQFTELPKIDSVVSDALNYIIERFKAWYDEMGLAAEIFQSVNAKGLSQPLDIDNRVKAVAQFRTLPQALSLAAANKRVSNILAKHSGAIATEINASLLENGAETVLANALADMQQRIEPLFLTRNYSQILTTLAQLREAVDPFFDQVMVMTENLDVRNNRLALLNQLRNLFLNVADISYLDVKSDNRTKDT